MKKIMAIIGLVSIITLAGCGEAPVATLEPEGVETILVEEIVVEEIRAEPIQVTTWDNATISTWAD